MKKTRTITIRLTDKMVEAGIRELEDYDCRDSSRASDAVLDMFYAMCGASDNPSYAIDRIAEKTQ